MGSRPTCGLPASCSTSCSSASEQCFDNEQPLSLSCWCCGKCSMDELAAQKVMLTAALPSAQVPIRAAAGPQRPPALPEDPATYPESGLQLPIRGGGVARVQGPARAHPGRRPGQAHHRAADPAPPLVHQGARACPSCCSSVCGHPGWRACVAVFPRERLARSAAEARTDTLLVQGRAQLCQPQDLTAVWWLGM